MPGCVCLRVFFLSPTPCCLKYWLCVYIYIYVAVLGVSILYTIPAGHPQARGAAGPVAYHPGRAGAGSLPGYGHAGCIDASEGVQPHVSDQRRCHGGETCEASIHYTYVCMLYEARIQPFTVKLQCWCPGGYTRKTFIHFWCTRVYCM